MSIENRKLSKFVDRLYSELNELKSHGKSKTKSGFKGLERKGELFQGKFSGSGILDPFSCVKLKHGFDDEEETYQTKDLPLIVLPDEEDDEENAMYGTLINTVNFSKELYLGIVQISGSSVFRRHSSATSIKFGERVYPIHNSIYITNKDSGIDGRIDIPIGRALQNAAEDDESILISMTSIGKSFSMPFVKASDLSLAIPQIGAQTVDSISCVVGDLVLLSDGVYEVAEEEWTFVEQYEFVIVKQGTLRGETAFYYDTFYKGLGGYYK